MSAKESTKLLFESLRDSLPQRPDRTRALGRQWLLDQLSPRDAARCVAWVHSQHIRYPQVFSLSSLALLAYINHTEWWAYNSVFIRSYSAPHRPMSPPLLRTPSSSRAHLLPSVFFLSCMSFFPFLSFSPPPCPSNFQLNLQGGMGPRAPLPLWRSAVGGGLGQVLSQQAPGGTRV